MRNDTAIIPISPEQTADSLKQRLDAERAALLAAEADLSREQAAVNAFRMQCRLKIGEWVDTVLALRAERESLVAQLQINLMAMMIWQQDQNNERDEDAYWEFDAWLHSDDELILPTASPEDRAAEKQLYRQLVKKFHPDRANAGAERVHATMMMTSINAAWAQGDIDTLRNLAGALDPELEATLNGGETAVIRRLCKHLLACKRRKVRVAAQARLLHCDDTTRLWRKAARLEEQGQTWWIEVRAELEREIGRLEQALRPLRKQAGA